MQRWRIINLSKVIIFILFQMYEGDADQKIKYRGSMPFWVYIKQRKSILMKKSNNWFQFCKKITKKSSQSFKGAATNMRYLARSNFSRSLVHKKNFS